MVVLLGGIFCVTKHLSVFKYDLEELKQESGWLRITWPGFDSGHRQCVVSSVAVCKPDLRLIHSCITGDLLFQAFSCTLKLRNLVRMQILEVMPHNLFTLAERRRRKLQLRYETNSFQ
jgi:hypothetical protein